MSKQKLKQKLKLLYRDSSKHSSYQNVPAFVKNELGYVEKINEEWRGDSARIFYILKQLDFSPGFTVGDIGANTGFFSLSLANQFKKTNFIAYEINKNHFEHVRLIVNYFNLNNLNVVKLLINKNNIIKLCYHDILLHLNVLHHAGFDFDKKLEKNLNVFEKYALDYLSKIRCKTKLLVFQMGSNWGGDKNIPIVESDDDVGKIIYISNLFARSGWLVKKIAVATRNSLNTIVYENLPQNIIRKLQSFQYPDNLSMIIKNLNPGQFNGEFYRRQIFICDSNRF